MFVESDYIGKSAIEWIRERYKVTIHKVGGIINDLNGWCVETATPAIYHQPEYKGCGDI